MSVFDEVNRDEVSSAPQDVATSKRLDFLGAFEASYDAQVKASAQFGIEYAIRNKEQENIRRIRRLGENAPVSLNNNEDSQLFAGMTAGLDSEQYTSLMRAMAEGDDAAAGAVVGDRNDKLRALQAKHPNAGIVTYDDMFAQTRQEAREAENRAAQSPTTIGGDIGGFIGATAGALDLRVNPLNFATLPIGGAGKSVISRIATQAGGQSAIEALNQYTGVREQREVLGLPKTTAESVLLAGVGGAAVQGVGEGLSAGVRAAGKRWFRSTPTDVAPEPPAPAVPRSEPAAPALRSEPAALAPETRDVIRSAVRELPGMDTRMMQARGKIDFDHVSSRLDAWDAEEPWRIAPPTDTRALMPETIRRPEARVFREVAAQPGESLDVTARRLDPQTFEAYDLFNARKAVLRQQLTQADALVEASRASLAAREVRAQVETLRAQLGSATKKQAKQLEQRIADLEASVRDTPLAAADNLGDVSSRQAALRADLMRADEKMRDLAPSVSRAYARARDEWAADAALREQIDRMIAEGRTELPLPSEGVARADVTTPTTFAEQVPELAQRPDVVVGPNENPVDVVNRVKTDDLKTQDEALEVFAASVKRALSDEAEPTITLKEGITLHLDNDTITVPNRNGEGQREISIRQLLKEANEDSDILEAISTCRTA